MSGSNISISSGNVYIKQNNGVIQSSLNNTTYSDISWPLTIQRSGLGTEVITVYIVNNLTITETNQYFIVGSNNITFNGYFNTTYQTITITDYTTYNGLIQNGSGTLTENRAFPDSTTYPQNQIYILEMTSPIYGYNNININNIYISINSNVNLNSYNGFICQAFFGYGSTGNVINNCSVIYNIPNGPQNYNWIGLIAGVYCNFNSISNCSSNNYLGTNCGGILGSYSSCATINNCYNTGTIGNWYSGGIVGSFFQSSCTITNCFSKGNFSNQRYSGGIFANNIGYTISPNTAVTITMNNCYSLGNGNNTYNSASGLIGGNIYCIINPANYPVSYTPTNPPTNKPTININNCYVYGLFDTISNNGINPPYYNQAACINCHYISYSMYGYYSSLTVNSCYYNGGGIWNDANAKRALNNIGGRSWIYPSPENSLPYILKSMTTTSPLCILSQISYPYFYVYVGSNITLYVNYIGSTPVVCSWYYNNELIPNQTSYTYTITGAQLSQDGKYTCKIYNNVNSIDYKIYLNVVPTTYTVIQAITDSNDNSGINISQSGSDIVYNLNYGINTTITNWPVIILGSLNNSNSTFIILTNLIFTNPNQYFIMGSSNLNFSNYDPSGRITINLNFNSPYNGIFQNGTSTKNGYDGCSINKIIVSGTATVSDYGGFLCQSYWNVNSSNPGGISSCSSTINITGNYSGGLLGAYSNVNTIRNCYTSGNIIGNYAGGVIGAYFNNLNYQYGSTIDAIYSIGNISGNNSGGIFGGYSTFNNGIYMQNLFSIGNISGTNSGGILGSDTNFYSPYTINFYNCYSLGNISNNAGGFLGGMNQLRTTNLILNIYNSYVCSLFNNNNAIVAPSLYNYVNLTLNNTYITNSWSNSTASTTLTQTSILPPYTNIWTTYTNNIPYTLQVFNGQTTYLDYNYASPVCITSTSANQILVVGSNLSIQVLANGTDPITYQWQYSSNGSIYTNLSGTTYNYLLSGVQKTNSGYYRCIASNVINSMTSNPIIVTVLSNTSPTLTNISQNLSGTSGGNTITLTGTNFNTNCVVLFGTVSTGAITIVNTTTLNVIVPANSAGVVNIIVKNNSTNETSPITTSSVFIYGTLPTVPLNISATPNNSSASITWTLNDPSQYITYYTVYCSNALITPLQTNTNSINFTNLSNNIVYTFTVTATNIYGTSAKSSNSNSVIPRNSPSITNILNGSGLNYSLVGTSIVSITIAGTNFYSPIVNIISSDGKTSLTVSSLVVSSDQSITCSISNAFSGIFNFNITDIGGNTKFNNGYTFYNTPTITSISPNSGSTVGGTSITITGTNLIYITSITFDGSPITVYNSTSTTLTFKTLTYGTNPNPTISITTLGVIINTNLFNYVSPPTLTSTDASVNGQLIITGTNFTNASVFINNILTTFSITGTTQITITNYTYHANDIIQIQNIGGQISFSNLSSNGTYSYTQTTITSINTA